MSDLPVTPHLVVPARELSWNAARASGPGGQNVNKVATKVDLRFDVARTSVLDDAVKARLQRIYARRFDAEGRLVVVSEAARTQSGNLALARERLAEMIRAALVVPKRRRATKPSRAAKTRRIEHKRRHAEKKAARTRVV